MESDTSVAATIGRINDVLVLDDQILVAIEQSTEPWLSIVMGLPPYRRTPRSRTGRFEHQRHARGCGGHHPVSQLNNRLTRLTPDLE